MWLLRALALLIACASPAAGQAVLKGFVREDSTLRPLADVEVIVEGATRSYRTNGAGAYAMSDLTPGRRMIQVRRVGFDPIETTLDLVNGTQEHVFYLKRSAQSLDTVVVQRPAPRGIGREAFEERRKLGLGKFIDSTELRAHEHRKLQDLLRQTGVRVVMPVQCGVGARIRSPYCDTNPSKRVAVSTAMAYECPMKVVIDGVTLYRPRGQSAIGALAGDFRNVEWESTFDLSSLMVSALESVEIYRRAAEVPIEFGGSSAACGVLVIWTRRSR